MRAGERAGRAIGLAQSTDAGRCDRPIVRCLNPRGNIAVLKKSCAKWRRPRTRARRTTSSLNNYPAILFADCCQRTPEQAAREGPSGRNFDITAAAENRRSMHFLRVALSFRGGPCCRQLPAGAQTGRPQWSRTLRVRSHARQACSEACRVGRKQTLVLQSSTSRPLRLRLGTQVESAAHPDVVEVLIQETAGRAAAAGAQHAEEVIVGRQLGV